MLYTYIQKVLFYSVTYLPATPLPPLPPFSVKSSISLEPGLATSRRIVTQGICLIAWNVMTTDISGQANRPPTAMHNTTRLRQCKAIGVQSHSFGHRQQHSLCDYRFIVRTVVRTPILIWLPWRHVKLLSIYMSVHLHCRLSICPIRFQCAQFIILTLTNQIDFNQSHRHVAQYSF